MDDHARKRSGPTVAVVGPTASHVIDYRVLAAELARAADDYLLTADQGIGIDKARLALEHVVARYKAGTLDGLTDLRRAVHRTLFQLRTIANQLPPEAKRILQELAAVVQR